MGMAGSRRVIIVVVLVAVVVLVVAGLVTPGFLRYDYKTMNMGMFGSQQIRTDRLTGKTEIYGAGKWQPIEFKDGQVRVPQGTTMRVK